jgi:hypothetical protein
MSGYVVTVTRAGDVLPGDLWEWSQGYRGGEKTVREVVSDRVVFDDGMTTPLSAVTRAGGIWTLKSRGVERHPVDTLEEAKRLVRSVVAKLKLPDGPTTEAANRCMREAHALGESGGSLSLPDGSTITVEPVERRVIDQASGRRGCVVEGATSAPPIADGEVAVAWDDGETSVIARDRVAVEGWPVEDGAS